MSTATATTIWKQSNFKIKPCILVTEKLTVERGVSYDRRDVYVTPHNDGSEDAVWETQRHYKNKEETKRADQIYSNARFRIRSKCLYTEVGYICPASEQAALEKAVDEAREMIEEFNKKAVYCHITFRVMCTRIEPTNEDGIEALRETINKNVAGMKQALAEFDIKKAKNILIATKPSVDILSDSSAKKSLLAVREEARSMAMEIANVLKQYDNNVENALVSHEGQDVLGRVAAKWNF